MLTVRSLARLARPDGSQRAHAQARIGVIILGIPFLYGPAHPRGAGTFSRVLGRYVREKKAIGLMDALAKMTILPARRLEGATEPMMRKGRVQVGADADLTIFDPERILDLSTHEDGDVPSQGIVQVLVDGVVQDGLFPGQPMLGSR